jgi:hypothetical protein
MIHQKTSKDQPGWLDPKTSVGSKKTITPKKLQLDEETPEWLDLNNEYDHKNSSDNCNDSETDSLRSRKETRNKISPLGLTRNLSINHIRDDEVEDVDSSGRSWIERKQRISGLVSILLSWISLIIVCAWVTDEAMGGGGVSWEEGDAQRVFNWHPVLMILSFIFMTTSSLAFRFDYHVTATTGSTFWTPKRLHVLGWSLTIITASLGITAVVKSHNDPESGYIANFYSFHSWMACIVIFLYLSQFISSAIFFGSINDKILRCCHLNCINSDIQRQRLLTFHRYLGNFLHLAVGSTILTGIQEKEGFIQCHYKVTDNPDNPFHRQGKIPEVCKTSHFLAIFIFIIMFTTSFALHSFSSTPFKK